MTLRTVELLWLALVMAVGSGCGGSDGSAAAGESPLECAAPAPLTPADAKGSSFIVLLKDDAGGREVAERVAALEAKHGFKSSTVFKLYKQFVATLEPSQLASLRCDPEVASVHENGLSGTHG